MTISSTSPSSTSTHLDVRFAVMDCIYIVGCRAADLSLYAADLIGDLANHMHADVLPNTGCIWDDDVGCVMDANVDAYVVQDYEDMWDDTEEEVAQPLNTDKRPMHVQLKVLQDTLEDGYYAIPSHHSNGRSVYHLVIGAMDCGTCGGADCGPCMPTSMYKPTDHGY